jgi:hydrogenase expression/formation protein HypE
MQRGDFVLSCPAPVDRGATVQLSHGGGGRHMRRLLDELFLPAFSNAELERRHDSAVLAVGESLVAFTTDSYVVSPLFFPGGDIGKLAVFGTANDLAMAGAIPKYLSAGFVLEEGLPLETLRRVVASMAGAAREAGVELVTGDTKVVDRGKGDGVFVNTAGIGVVPEGRRLSPANVRPGQAVLLSGDVGRHGAAILSVRDGLELEAAIESDCAPLAPVARSLMESGVDAACFRDLTRGGLAAALNEIALDAGVSIEIDERAVPVSDPVAALCELLGLDPLYVANEGRMVALVPEENAETALDVMRRHPVSREARRIGRVEAGEPGRVIARGAIGRRRVLDLLSGEQLPRIC